MWQWELLSTRGQTMPTKGLIISFLKHISSLVVEIACFFSFFFPEPTAWCIQFLTVLELSKSHPESTRYSSLVLEKCAAIMNIMTVFVYRAGRQDIKVSLLMTNIKDMSVFRDGGIMSIEGSNPIFSMCVIAEMILLPCWRRDCEGAQQEMAQ